MGVYGHRLETRCAMAAQILQICATLVDLLFSSGTGS